jgi:3-hydroxyanthranilate 3,4-dioxygenase
MTWPSALPLARWIDEHRDLLKPPVGNKCIVDGDFIVMIVGGPNERSDWHVEEGPEFFYQIEGEMVLRLMEDGRPRDVPIRAGEMYYLPPNVPHSPQRMAGSVGLVIERRRRAGELDALEWYCPSCNHRVYAERFPLEDIETQFPAVFERFYRSIEHRTCPACGTVHPAPARYADA